MQHDLASLFLDRRATLDRWWQNRKLDGYEAVSSALKFPFWKEVSKNRFVFDVVKFRKSYKSASFLAGSSSQIDTTALFSSVQIGRLDR